MRDPVAPEVDQQPDRASDVEHDHEGQPRRLGLGLPDDDVVPAKQRREQNRVSQAGDREQLGGALEDAEHDRLEGADQVGSGKGEQSGNVEREGSGRMLASAA
jgi:hypothetical protein